MNRHDRRIYEKKYGKEFAMQKYREEAIKQGEQTGVKSAINVILYMTAYTINYKLGFGRKRLIRIMKQIIENIDCYRTGQLTPEDYKEIIELCNKMGFKVSDI